MKLRISSSFQPLNEPKGLLALFAEYIVYMVLIITI
jgi:hypothetical protein